MCKQFCLQLFLPRKYKWSINAHPKTSHTQPLAEQALGIIFYRQRLISPIQNSLVILTTLTRILPSRIQVIEHFYQVIIAKCRTIPGQFPLIPRIEK